MALYEYGKSSIPADEGHMRMILPLTTNLDKVSEELFLLETNGGEEYCGMVIQAAVKNLQWSESRDDLKLIFIAGNEPFTQGTVHYVDACKAAINEGIIVNTIHCGSDQAGVDGKWKDGALLADGRYTCIDKDRAIVHIDAPQDAEIARLGVELNATYIAYGSAGAEGLALQKKQDANAMGVAAASNAMRQMSKASGQYRNSRWDLIDRLKEPEAKLEDIDEEALPEEMRGMTMEEKKAYVEGKAARRAEIQEKIRKLGKEREAYVAEERKKLAEKTGKETLDEAIIKIVRTQAAARGFTFEKIGE